MLTAHQVLEGYLLGVFPMADEDNHAIINWYEPKKRGIILPSDFKVSKSLRLLYQKNIFDKSINKDFEATMRACANRGETWISEDIIEVFMGLKSLKFGYSFEIWQDKKLVGGLYGVRMGNVFFGESMFHTVSNASKLAMVYLMEWAIETGIQLIDCQYITDHLKQFGAKEITQKAYLKLLGKNVLVES